MGVVRRSIFAGVLVAVAFPASLSQAQPTAGHMLPWQPYVAEAATRFGVPPPWIVAVIAAESGGHAWVNGRPITSPAGALGLMQLIPETYAEMRQSHGLGADPHDPRDNILAGTAYLRAMFDRFGYPGLFAAYNAGPGRYERHLSTGQVLPAETMSYLAAIENRSLFGAVSPPQNLAGGPLKPIDLASETRLFFIRNGTPVQAQLPTFVIHNGAGRKRPAPP